MYQGEASWGRMRCTADWVCRSDNHNRIILSYSDVARYRKKRPREGLHFSGSSPVGSALVNREQFWIRNKNRLDSPAALARTTCARSRHAEADLEIDKKDKLYQRICRPWCAVVSTLVVFARGVAKTIPANQRETLPV